MQLITYDKGKYHDDGVITRGLPEEHADHHIVFFLRWLINNDLMSEKFCRGPAGQALQSYLNGRRSIFWLFRWWDRCLASDMLSERGNAFAQEYFDYDRGNYLADYEEILASSLPTLFHVEFNDENYQQLAERINERWVSHSGMRP